MNSVDQPKSLKGILFFSKSMGDQKNLIIDHRKSHENAHFVAFNMSFRLETWICLMLYSDSNYQKVVDHKSLVRTLNRLLKLGSIGKIRTIRKFSYNKLSFHQQGNECGAIATLITIISNMVDNDYLKKFVIKNYSTSIVRIKLVIASILLDRKLDSGAFGFWFFIELPQSLLLLPVQINFVKTA